jgi:uncharacterized protein YbjT (DUF2867 family)
MPASGATDGTILVTGASGLAGSAVIREFVRNGYPVRALVRSRAKARAFQAFPTVQVVEGDLSRPQTLEDALAGVDRVLVISSPDQQMAERQSRFIDAARKAEVRHIVKFSGLSAADVGTPFVFGSMHAEIERHLEGSGLRQAIGGHDAGVSAADHDHIGVPSHGVSLVSRGSASGHRVLDRCDSA